MGDLGASGLDGVGATAATFLIFWISGSVLLYALASNILWWLKDSWRPRYRPWLVQAGRILFYLGIPYLALGGWPQRPYHGLLSLQDLGFVGFDSPWPVTRWLEGAGTGLGWGLVSLLILTLAWASANRRVDGVQFWLSSQPWWILLIDVLCLEVHWAFYRGAIALVLNDLYAGVFFGLGLVYLEWSLSPFWRRGWRTRSQSGERWLQVALALVVALLFLLTRNLWVCLVVHWLLAFAFWRLGREHGKKMSLQASGHRPPARDKTVVPDVASPLPKP